VASLLLCAEPKTNGVMTICGLLLNNVSDDLKNAESCRFRSLPVAQLIEALEPCRG